jgi:hypothetical protein
MSFQVSEANKITAANAGIAPTVPLRGLHFSARHG